MPIAPFFNDESIDLEESLSSLAGALDPSIEDKDDVETTSKIVSEEHSTECETCTKEDTNSNVNVTINGEPYSTPSSDKTEEESKIQEELETESEIEEDIESTSAEMHVLNTMLDCSKYCATNKIEKLEKTASIILGYESLYPGTEGLKELAIKVWDFIKSTAIKVYNYCKEIYEKYIAKKIREFTAESKTNKNVSENREAFEQALNETKGRYIKVDEFKPLISQLKNIGSDTVNAAKEMDTLVKSPNSINVENGYAKAGGVNFDRLRDAAQSLQEKVRSTSTINGTLAEAGFKADAKMVVSLIELVDREMAKAVDWTRIANSMQVISREVDSMKAVDSNDESLADKLKALTSSMGAIQNAAGSLALATRGLWSTTEAYIKAYNEAIKGAPKDPAEEKE